MFVAGHKRLSEVFRAMAMRAAAASKQRLLLAATSARASCAADPCRHFVAEANPSSAAVSGGGLNFSELLQQLQKPKVAPLPEDRVVERQEQEQVLQVSRRVPRPQVEDIPLPSFVVTKQEKRPDPVGLLDAIRLVKSGARARFDETLEAHVRLSVDPRRGDQMVRGAATLPHGTGKVVRVAVFAEGAAAQEAQAAGADIVGADELVNAIKDSGGKLDFDKCVATPSFMPKLGKVARILGPRGLMPNPKVRRSRLGTVTNNVADAVRAAKQGRVDFKVDKTGIVHAGLGKVSFSEAALQENMAAFVAALLGAKPVGLKKSSRYAGYVNKIHLSSTMGSGVPVSIQSVAVAADNYIKTTEIR